MFEFHRSKSILWPGALQISQWILSTVCGFSAGAETTWSGDALVIGTQRTLNQNQFSDYKSLIEFTGALGLDFNFRYQDFDFAIRPELRGMSSPGVGADSKDIAAVSVLGPKRLLALGFEVEKTSNRQIVADLEKLSLSFQTSHVEMAIGRRPLGLGVLKFLPVWNRFSIVLPNQSGPPFIYNPDNIVLRYQQNSWALGFIGVGGVKSEDLVSLAQLNYFGDWLEVQTLLGRWWDRTAGGFAISKDINGLTLRSESLWVGLSSEDKEHFYQWGLGLEMALTDKLSANFEGLYLQDGANDPADYPVFLPSKFNLFRASRYGLLSIEYKFLPNWRFLGGPLTNFVDGSSLLLGDLRWSATQNLDFSLQAKVPVGPKSSEFSTETFTFDDGSSIGYPYLINLQMKSFF